jgi:UDP-N-acetylmuramoyl-tripeptide--D-alanyl-D-alanine ligase
MSRRLHTLLDRALGTRAIAPFLFFLARWVLRVRRPLVIAVTGSAGKTTTTAMVTSMLAHPEIVARIGSAVGTQGNMNNLTGVPLTVLLRTRWLPKSPVRRVLALAALPWHAIAAATWRPYPKVLVLECAAGYLGQVERLVRLVRPRIGVVTNIGPSHLHRFGDLDGVFREKSAMVRHLPHHGLAVIGEGHDHVEALARCASAPVVRIDGRGHEQTRGTCRAIGRYLGLPGPLVDAALETFAPPRGRLNVVAVGSWTVIDDSYNANPLSMRLGLETLTGCAAPGQRRVAFLGQMNELGEHSDAYHEEIGRLARRHCDLLVGVGEQARHYRPDHWFATSSDCAQDSAALVRPGDCLLVKGSAAIEMGRVVAALRREAEGGRQAA